MFAIQSLDHIVLRTNCIDEMMNFYCDILHAKVEQKQEVIRLTQIRIGENLIDLVEVDDPVEVGNGNLSHFCVRIKPFDYPVLEEYFKSHGIEPERFGHRYGSQGMGDSFYIYDPQGNEVELCEAVS